MADDTRYAYAVARVRGMETRLLDHQWVERLLSESADGALKALSDSQYQDAFSEVTRPEDIEAGLVNALAETFSVLSEISPEPELMGLFRLRWDFRNLKTIIKAVGLKTDVPRGALVDGVGTVGAAVLEAAVRDKDYIRLPQVLADAAREGDEAYREQGEIAEIDRILDRRMWGHTLAVASTSRNEFLIGFLRTEIDLSNIQTFARVKEAGKDRTDLVRVILPGGTLEPSFFADRLEEAYDAFAMSIEYGAYGDLTPVFREWAADRSFPLLSRACDDHILKKLEVARTAAYGIEPLVAFIIYRQMEIKLLRSSVVAKLDGVERSEVESRLRSLHV